MDTSDSPTIGQGRVFKGPVELHASPFQLPDMGELCSDLEAGPTASVSVGV